MPSSTKWAIGCLAILLVLLQYRLWVRPQGIIDMFRLKKALALQVEASEQLKKRNQLLLEQVVQLQNNKEAVESRARHDLGMIKKGETFYRVVENK